MNGTGDPGRLVARQRVHRVDDDRLDAAPTGPLSAVVQDGLEVALGLARARACGDQRGLSRGARQTLHGGPLMVVGREALRHLGQRLAARRLPERQVQRQIGSPDQVRAVGQEVVDDVRQFRIRRLEAGQEEVAEGLDDFGGDDGGDHGGEDRVGGRIEMIGFGQMGVNGVPEGESRVAPAHRYAGAGTPAGGECAVAPILPCNRPPPSHTLGFAAALPAASNPREGGTRP